MTWIPISTCFSCIFLLTLANSAAAQVARDGAEDVYAKGKQLFELHCARCHGMQGAGGVGSNLRRPRLRHAANESDLRSVIKGGIPGTGMRGNWFLTEDEAVKIAGFVQTLQQTSGQSVTGDPARGRQIYEQNQCAVCHMVNGAGGNQGPDLTEVAVRRGPNFLRRAILHPGQEKVLDAGGYPMYLSVMALTREGTVISGLRMNEDTFTIQVRDNQNHIWSLQKANLELLKKSSVSVMPPFADKLAAEEIDHLVAWLATVVAE